MAIREGSWDCPSCSTRVRGMLKVCSSCGAPRPKGVRFNPPGANAPAITDSEKLREAKAGPDWYCNACGSANSALRGNCKQCGAEKGASPSHGQSTARSTGAHVTYVSDEPESIAERYTPLTHEHYSATSSVGASLPVSNSLLIFIGAAILVAILAFFLLRTTDLEMTIAGFSWHRSISIEEYRTVQGKKPGQFPPVAG